MRRLLRGITLVAMLAAVHGCAPRGFEEGLAFYADQYHVRDAAARRAEPYWYLRFDELILSDLDDAIQSGREGNTEEMRRLGLQSIRAAASLAVEAGWHEIDRLPGDGRTRLAEAVGTPDDSNSLKQAYQARAADAAGHFLAELESAKPAQTLDTLVRVRSFVEALPDDRGRLGRQLFLAWGAVPAWTGVENIEKQADQSKGFAPFDKGVTFMPEASGSDEQLADYAPIIVIEAPEHRDYPADCDRFGEVYLTGDPAHVDVHVNTSRPTGYAYRSEAKINGKRYPQLVYVWWFPERPSMSKNDPAAGRIDGDTLRMTLGSNGRPAIFEVVQGCGCGHLVYVADHVEQAARKEFGPAEAGKEFSVERDVASKRDLIVSGTIFVPAETCRPVVYVVAGYHAVSGLRCEPPAAGFTVESHPYRLDDYDRLDHLPLGDGFGSMFGADGLVHNAGRREGYLLAPTGILSAGQPRKRGTQRIRWDEYNFEDPRLLEKALRLPSDM